MAYYSLTQTRSNVKDIPKKNCYITIVPYPKNYMKPERGKKLTKEEAENKRKCIAEHVATVKQLETGTFNMYNNSIDTSTVLSSSYTSLIKDFENNVVYRIKPLASREDRSAYGSVTNYKISEFNVVKKITNRQELIKQLAEDYILEEFSAEVFNNYCYGNEGYPEILYDYFVEVKNDYPDIEIGLEDILLTSDYYHSTRDHFRAGRIYDLTKQNLRKLLDEGLIKYIAKYNYNYTKVITALIGCGLSDIALNFLNEVSSDKYINISKDQDLNAVLKLHSADEFVKLIIEKLSIKLDEVVLVVEESQSYGSDKTTELKFNNISEVKSYLIKTYDIPFDVVSKTDISEIEHRIDDDAYYTFNIK